MGILSPLGVIQASLDENSIDLIFYGKSEVKRGFWYLLILMRNEHFRKNSILGENLCRLKNDHKAPYITAVVAAADQPIEQWSKCTVHVRIPHISYILTEWIVLRVK